MPHTPEGSIRKVYASPTIYLYGDIREITRTSDLTHGSDDGSQGAKKKTS